MNYKQFIQFAAQKQKLKFEVTKFIIRGFLQKHNLISRVIESYLLYSKTENLIQTAKQLNVNEKTIRWDLEKLKSVCPELFVKRPKIPKLYQMLHLPNEDNWENNSFFEYFGEIKEKF